MTGMLYAVRIAFWGGFLDMHLLHVCRGGPA